MYRVYASINSVHVSDAIGSLLLDRVGVGSYVCWGQYCGLLIMYMYFGLCILEGWRVM